MGENCRDHNDDEGVVQPNIRVGIHGMNDEIAQVYPDKTRSYRMTYGASLAYLGCVASISVAGHTSEPIKINDHGQYRGQKDIDIENWFPHQDIEGALHRAGG